MTQGDPQARLNSQSVGLSKTNNIHSDGDSDHGTVPGIKQPRC